MQHYKVLVDDNFHYQDPAERRELGVFDTVEQAIAACQRVVDKSLIAEFRPGMSATSLFEHYKSFGDDPYIVVIGGTSDGSLFSAWSYAKERCRAICGDDDTALKL